MVAPQTYATAVATSTTRIRKTNMQTQKIAMKKYSVCRKVLAPLRTLFETYFMATKPSGASRTFLVKRAVTTIVSAPTQPAMRTPVWRSAKPKCPGV